MRIYFSDELCTQYDPQGAPQTSIPSFILDMAKIAQLCEIMLPTSEISNEDNLSMLLYFMTLYIG